MGFLILQTADVRLVVEGVDTLDEDPLVLRSYCRGCGAVLHTRLLVATETTLKTSRALAHRVVCRVHG